MAEWQESQTGKRTYIINASAFSRGRDMAIISPIHQVHARVFQLFQTLFLWLFSRPIPDGCSVSCLLPACLCLKVLYPRYFRAFVGSVDNLATVWDSPMPTIPNVAEPCSKLIIGMAFGHDQSKVLGRLPCQSPLRRQQNLTSLGQLYLVIECSLCRFWP